MGVFSPTHVNFFFLVWLGYLLQFLFVFGLIYLLMLFFGSFTLGRLFDFISVYHGFNGALYFVFENLFCGIFFKLLTGQINWSSNDKSIVIRLSFDIQISSLQYNILLFWNGFSPVFLFTERSIVHWY